MRLNVKLIAGSAGLIALSSAFGCQHAGRSHRAAAVEPIVAPAPHPQPPAGQPPAPKEAASLELNKAYDSLALADGLVRLSAGAIPGGKDLANKARSVYQASVKAFDRGDYARSVEFSRAASEVGRSLEHASRSTLTGAPDLTPPPRDINAPDHRRDVAQTRSQIKDLRARLAAAHGTPEARIFSQAGKQFLDEAEVAVKANNLTKARELALGGDALSRVADHLDLAQHAPVMAAH